MVLVREFPPDIRVENEIDALIQEGHDVHIACYTRKDRPLQETIGKLTIHRKSISNFIYKSSVASLTLPFYFRYWKIFLSEIFSTHSFDVIHIHDLPLARIGDLFHRSFNIKLVVDLHENWPAFLKISKHTNTILGKFLSPLFLWRQYEKNVLLKTDAIVVVAYEAKVRLALLGIPAGRINIVSNTINISDLKLPTPKSHNKTILYYAGGINYHRGLQNVMLALHKSKNKLIELWILGDGSYKTELFNLADRLNIKKQVVFHGYQPFKIVMDMLSESDFAIIPHLKSEHTDSTIPHKLFQYMYAQKPVIASDCIPLKRILEETGSGIVYPSDNIDYLCELFNRIEDLNYSEMASKGRKAVEEKYNWKFDGEVLINLYKKINQQ
jgi:glycosyltransferase involved in cell wall biosynthesis